MDFSFSEEQQLLLDTVRRYVADHYGFEQRKAVVASADGFSRQVWKDFGELGLLGLNVPAEEGGLGGGAVDTLLVAGAMGEGMVLEPFLASAVSATRLIAALGTPQQRREWLGAMSSASRVAVLAHDAAPPGERGEPVRAAPQGAGWTLTGRIAGVYHAPAADWLLVSAACAPHAQECDAVFGIATGTPGVKLHAFTSVDAQVAADVTLDGVRVEPAARVGGESADGAATTAALAAVGDFSAMSCCADALGALDAALALTVEYTRTRQQFGGPIGRFQALQHRMVDMLTRIEQARSLVYLAASRCDGADAAERAAAVSAAKVLVADAARFVGQQAVQLHGGMGVADESRISHYFKRLLAAEIRFGSAEAHLQRFAAGMAG